MGKSPIFHIDVDTVQRGSSGPDRGAIWLSIGASHFPAHGWVDSITVVAHSFAFALWRLRSRLSLRETVHFIDGPHQIDLVRIANDQIRLDGIDRGKRSTVQHVVNERELVAGFLTAARALRSRCRELGCASRELDELDLYALRLETSL